MLYMKPKLEQAKTLGPVSSRFISELAKRGRVIFTLDAAVTLYGRPRRETTQFLSDLMARGVIARIKAGVYFVVQMGYENIQLNNWPIIARELVGLNHYFISHYSAMRLHGMTTHPLFDAYITLSKRYPVKKIGEITYHFIFAQPKHCWGTSTLWVTKQDKVSVSDIERTILDACDRPDLCGGIKEIVRGIWVKQKQIDWNRMVKYASHYPAKSATKRLGFILELLNLGENCSALLVPLIATTKDYIFLDPSGLKTGTYLGRWRIKINMNVDELKASVWG